ncbi:MAG: 2-C-methyl-D-erythritol 4-phosphate cytidylyltransferase [Actinomycetota bacterium]|nr:2-C-methyl-D-erythritol 4-phosphate cytidylyltransferase [Actinomycetota bacterium]
MIEIENNDVAVVLMAAGTSTRYGRDKCLEYIDGSQSVLDYSYSVARRVSSHVLVAASGATFDYCERQGYPCVLGGSSRSRSVLNALSALSDFSTILVHDSSRPLASVELYRRVIDKVGAGHDLVVPVLPVVDSMKIKTESGFVTIDRSDKYLVQTPQGLSRSASARLLEAQLEATDESGAAEALGINVATVDGERLNVKITYPDDILLVRALLITTKVD